MSGFKEFTSSAARPLPVILLADVSGSMAADGKIDMLNRCVSSMIQVLGKEDDHRADIQIAVVTFGLPGARLHVPLTVASKVVWQPMKAAGATPLGAALTLTTQMLEDRKTISSRAYRPVLVFVSDGQPTDLWEDPLQALLASSRGAKADRLALAIGADADLEVLQEFISDPPGRVLRASDADRIAQFFSFVTMTVTGRSRSVAPNDKLPFEPDDIAELL